MSRGFERHAIIRACKLGNSQCVLITACDEVSSHAVLGSKRHNSLLGAAGLVGGRAVHLGDEVLDAKVLDHGLEDVVLGDLDLLDLDLGLLGDEVHLALTLLHYN